MTKKNYYQDSSVTEFTAMVKSVNLQENGLYEVVLDETYFYPEGGGQPGDRGSINNVEVTDVYKDGDLIVHLLDKEIETGKAECIIDNDHRLHYMIQHTAQHLFSAVLKHELNINTLSVHLGESETTVDIDKDSIKKQDLRLIEEICNKKIRENINVIYHETDDEGIKNFKTRRESKFSGYIRVVELEGYDFVPCGGVHLPSLSKIGLIKITGYEKIKDHLRIVFLAGDNAYRDYYEKDYIVQELNRRLSTRTHELLEGFNILEKGIGKIKYEQRETFKSFINLVYKSVTDNNPGYLEFENLPGMLIKNIATKLTNILNEPILILNINEKINWYLIDSKNGNIDFSEFKNILLPVIQGKGGGRKSIWQGSGDKKNLKEFRKRVMNYLTKLSNNKPDIEISHIKGL